ncbi:hypothetical protein I6G82_04785 [Lysinibacillus macroides]|uniref:Uncharacterized protein n=1 Tax=Lysinibacillus macroides TaxID=33935 RepID=A0A0N1J047_9BACI|nr:hypothetical protein [Lysinibacillus macroides]KOY80907.1 hypothetical protein ADM90_17200 [Lysinibacillus macroides]QPR68950.1 hypothetical protein I6G82_04785 [Lysinibacillus macroides]
MYENLGSEDSFDTYSSYQDKLKATIDALNQTLEKKAITFTQFYRFPTEDFHFKECVGRSKWAMNGGW